MNAKADDSHKTLGLNFNCRTRFLKEACSKYNKLKMKVEDLEKKLKKR